MERNNSKVDILESLPEDFDWALKMMNVEEMWKYTKGKGVKVAVMDTGLDTDHPDFDSIGHTINMFERNNNVEDDYGHGTHVAGLIAGKHTGVAPEVELYVTKVLNSDGLGNMTNIIDGITFAINNKVDVLCISLGINYKLPLQMEERIKKAVKQGIIVVCATGNSSKKPPEFPAQYDYVIGVGGMEQDGTRATYSNYGWDMDVMAPSTDVVSTHLDGKYARMTGTSFSAPLVAGGVALLKAYYREHHNVELNTEDIKEMLKKLSPKKRLEYGYGLFDIAKLMD